MDWLKANDEFPINRRHQGLATLCRARQCGSQGLFPINRRHQGLATGPTGSPLLMGWRWCFQSIGVTKDWRLFKSLAAQRSVRSFQSIGVTKDWRRDFVCYFFTTGKEAGFQSIGVTKDWRPCVYCGHENSPLGRFQSIGVTKDWRRLRKWKAHQCLTRFQSIGVTKDWRLL